MPDLSLLPPSAAVDGEDIRIGGCLLGEIADRFGTPAYVLDEAALRSRAREYAAALARRHPRGLVCFAAKAYPSASVIAILAEEGLGCDVVGAGELRIALAAGVAPAKIVMHGNAKTDEDIRAALDARIRYIVVDSFDEIDRIARLARERTPVLLRVNPAIDSPTHAALATGGAGAKFGVPVAQVPEAIARMRAVPAIDLQGLHARIGSQILELEQFEAEVAMLARRGSRSGARPTPTCSRARSGCRSRWAGLDRSLHVGRPFTEILRGPPDWLARKRKSRQVGLAGAAPGAGRRLGS